MIAHVVKSWASIDLFLCAQVVNVRTVSYGYNVDSAQGEGANLVAP